MRRNPQHRLIVVAIARAMLPYLDSPELGPQTAACELSRNASMALIVEPDLDAEALIADMIRHRMRHGWLACGDVQSCARLGADAWMRVSGIVRRAAA